MRRETLLLTSLLTFIALGIHKDSAATMPVRLPPVPPQPGYGEESNIPFVDVEKIAQALPSQTLPSHGEIFATPTPASTPLTSKEQPPMPEVQKETLYNVFFYGSSSTGTLLNAIKTDQKVASLFTNMTVDGASVPGADLLALNDQFDKKCAPFRLDPNKKNIVVLQLGAIDLIHGKLPKEVLPAAESFAQRVAIRYPEAYIVLWSPNPTLLEDVSPSRQLEFARGLEVIAQAHGWGFADTAPLLMDGAKPQTGYYVNAGGDKLHLNPKGIEIVAPVIKNSIKTSPPIPLPKVP